MSTPMEPSSLQLPEGSRLLHIGPMKTGTTSIQSAASQQRSRLLEHGVLYPGEALNHRLAVGAFLRAAVARQAREGIVGQRAPAKADDPAIPPMSEWQTLQREIRSGNWQRALISHEITAQASDAQAQEFIDANGDLAHVVITLRDLTSILPAFWAQMLKGASTEPFDHWLHRALGDKAEQKLAARHRRQFDHARLVERWSSIVGPENTTVIISNKAKPNQLLQTFENLLGLPSGLLADVPTDGFSSNRSLSAPEAEFLLRLNSIVATNAIPWSEYTKLIREGVVIRLLHARSLADDEPRIRLPEWAVGPVQKIGKEHAGRIKASGVRIVGDLSDLYAPTPTSSTTELDTTSIDVALQAAAGMLSAAGGRGAFFNQLEPEDTTQLRPSAENVATAFTSRELAAALKLRVAHKLRTGRSQPLSMRLRDLLVPRSRKA